jgi:hypothetical protein
MPGPLPRRLAGCSCLLLPLQHRPSPTKVGSAYREFKRLLSGAKFRSSSHFFMFRPPSLLATLVAPHFCCFQQSSLWLLPPSGTFLVAFAGIGYASRPNQAIDGARTCTSLDSQPCRLLPLAFRYGFTSISGCQRNFHPRAVERARHTQKKPSLFRLGSVFAPQAHTPGRLVLNTYLPCLRAPERPSELSFLRGSPRPGLRW